MDYEGLAQGFSEGNILETDTSANNLAAFFSCLKNFSVAKLKVFNQLWFSRGTFKTE